MAPNRAIRGGSLSFSGVKAIHIQDVFTPTRIKLSHTKHVLQILNQYIVLFE